MSQKSSIVPSHLPHTIHPIHKDQPIPLSPQPLYSISSLRSPLSLSLFSYFPINSINILFSSYPLLLKIQTTITWQSHDYNHIHSPVLEELECLVGPDSDESFNWETLEGFQTFVDPTDPASHFTRTVYVMRLHIHCKPYLMKERGERGGEGKRQRNKRRKKGRREEEKNANDYF